MWMLRQLRPGDVAMYDDPSFSKFGVINILTSANLPLNQFSATFNFFLFNIDLYMEYM
jgi:hypothetical protein